MLVATCFATGREWKFPIILRAMPPERRKRSGISSYYVTGYKGFGESMRENGYQGDGVNVFAVFESRGPSI